MKLTNRLIGVLGLSCLSPLLWAADVPGSQDLQDVPRLADAHIVDYTVKPAAERIYPMGPIRKISGRLRFDGQVDARGETTAITYELPAGHSATEAFTAAREALQAKDAELLFWCQFVGHGTFLVGSVLGRRTGFCQLAADALTDPLAQWARIAGGWHFDLGVDVAGGRAAGVAGL